MGSRQSRIGEGRHAQHAHLNTARCASELRAWRCDRQGRPQSSGQRDPGSDGDGKPPVLHEYLLPESILAVQRHANRRAERNGHEPDPVAPNAADFLAAIAQPPSGLKHLHLPGRPTGHSARYLALKSESERRQEGQNEQHLHGAVEPDPKYDLSRTVTPRTDLASEQRELQLKSSGKIGQELSLKRNTRPLAQRKPRKLVSSCKSSALGSA